MAKEKYLINVYLSRLKHETIKTDSCCDGCTQGGRRHTFANKSNMIN